MDLNELAQKQIYELKPLEMVNAKELGIGQGFSILKVPGGWIFIFIDSSCFVPEPKMEVELQQVISGTKLDDALKKPTKKQATKKSKAAGFTETKTEKKEN
jgi:hypothetical protein